MHQFGLGAVPLGPLVGYSLFEGHLARVAVKMGADILETHLLGVCRHLVLVLERHGDAGFLVVGQHLKVHGTATFLLRRNAGEKEPHRLSAGRKGVELDRHLGEVLGDHW